VLIRDPRGTFRTQALLCTDLDAEPLQILSWFVRRWQLEVTSHAVRAHLGVETQRETDGTRHPADHPCPAGPLLPGDPAGACYAVQFLPRDSPVRLVRQAVPDLRGRAGAPPSSSMDPHHFLRVAQRRRPRENAPRARGPSGGSALPCCLNGESLAERPSEKASPPGQAPQHQADHTDRDECLAGAAQPLVVLAEPAGVGLPRERPLHHPAPRQHPKAGRGQVLRPVDLVVGQVLEDPDLLVAGAMLDDLRAPAERRFDPVLAFAAPIVAGVQPDMLQPREPGGDGSASSNFTPSRSMIPAEWTLTASTRPSVSTSRWRLRPLTCLPPS
jgi:hypothetical protein